MDKIHRGKVVVISGGLGDIGKATAISFAEQGAHVAISDVLPANEAYILIDELKSYDVKVSYDEVDVSNSAEVQTWLFSVERNMGLPSLIIPNAAIATLEGFDTLTVNQWERELQVNLNGAFYMAQFATRRLVEEEEQGRVIFVGSWAGHAVHSHLPAYSVSKAGLRMLCKCMALELAPHNILVNEIAPGYVDAGLSGKIWAGHPDMKKESEERVPIKRVMSAESVALQIVQLCHPDNDQMTGSTLLIDGGLSLLTP